jgi:pimeloyl-ACP methyl ester carboxylesterase
MPGSSSKVSAQSRRCGGPGRILLFGGDDAVDRIVVAVDLDHDWGGALAFDWAARHPERVLEQNLFVRQAFTGAVLTPVSDEELETYLVPYPTRDSRRSILAWARQLPLGGEPAGLVCDQYCLARVRPLRQGRAALAGSMTEILGSLARLSPR